MTKYEFCGFVPLGKPYTINGLVLERMVRRSSGGLANIIYITKPDFTDIMRGEAKIICTFIENGRETANFELEGSYQAIGNDFVRCMKKVRKNPRYVDPEIKLRNMMKDLCDICDNIITERITKRKVKVPVMTGIYTLNELN